MPKIDKCNESLMEAKLSSFVTYFMITRTIPIYDHDDYTIIFTGTTTTVSPNNFCDGSFGLRTTDNNNDNKTDSSCLCYVFLFLRFSYFSVQLITVRLLF